MVLPERSAEKALEKIEVMSSMTQGQFLKSSPSSSRALVFCSGGGFTRSFVVAKVIRIRTTDTTAKIAMVSWKPRVSLPAPRCLTSGRTKREIRNAAPNAPTKRHVEATVRVRGDGLITPSMAEYGTLTTV